MNTLEILTAARAKISEEKNWCQEAFARDSENYATSPIGKAACSWCSLGAMKTISRYEDYSNAETVLNYYTGGSVAHFNDSHTHSEVLAAWDKAIAECAKGVV